MTTIQQAKLEFAELMTKTQWALAEKKLSDFRRHPDWRRAAERVRLSRGEEFFILKLPDGRRAMPEEVADEFIDAVDREFSDEIIRNAGILR